MTERQGDFEAYDGDRHPAEDDDAPKASEMDWWARQLGRLKKD
jgi:hypothetical protein